MYKQHIISCRALDAWFCLSFNYMRLKPKLWMFLFKSKTIILQCFPSYLSHIPRCTAVGNGARKNIKSYTTQMMIICGLIIERCRNNVFGTAERSTFVLHCLPFIFVFVFFFYNFKQNIYHFYGWIFSNPLISRWSVGGKLGF